MPFNYIYNWNRILKIKIYTYILNTNFKYKTQKFYSKFFQLIISILQNNNN